MSTLKYPCEIKINPNQGGKAAIERLVEAYDFRTRQALADHLGISKSTLANRYMRDTFPSDWIIQCALETNVSLLWLTTGQGPKFEKNMSEIVSLPKSEFVENVLVESGYLLVDKKTLPTSVQTIFAVVHNFKTYFANKTFDKVSDGLWLVEYDNSIKIKEIHMLPDDNIRVSDEKLSFDCQKTDIKFIAKIFSLCFPC